ncbi:MAG: glycoside hydrolase domain-containing protein [Kiritimatiellia bacterium]
MFLFHRLNVSLILHVAAVLSISGISSKADAPPLELFVVSDAVRVFEDGYGFTNRQSQSKEINVFGLRNETISAQCVVRAGQDLSKLTAALQPLKRDGSTAQIPAENLTWNFVTDILVLTNTPKLRKSDLTRPAPARFPDCLSEERQCGVTNGALKAIYLTLRIPEAAEPGEYRGSLTVSAGEAAASLPVTLTVYPLTLPDQRHMLVAEWFSTHQFKKFHDVESTQSERYWQILRAYAKNMVEHRQNTFRIGLSLIKTTMDEKGQYSYDFSEFDQFAQVFWDTGRMDAMETGFVANHVPGGWSSLEIKIREFFTVYEKIGGKTKKIGGEEFLTKFLPAFVNHLREKKWLDKTLFHICDEPANHNVTSWQQASDFVHRHAPELRRIDAIETPHCLDRLEVWVPKLDHLSTWQGAFENAQRLGNEIWFYTVGIFQGGSLMNKTVDVPLIETRLMHWLNYRYDLKGYLHWGLNAWTDDPWNAPGKHRGDGWHVYPKRDGLLNSLRWEQMRNGLQDYECLWLLEDKTRQLLATLSPRAAKLIKPRQRSLEIASQVVSTYTDFSHDPQTLYAARRQAIEETLAFDTSPRIILQTYPSEHSVMANNCTIDINGWAEPGTRLKINKNQEVSMAPDGVFFARVKPSHTGSFTVEAENEKGSKVLSRKFRLQFQP